nr:phospholipase A and acyltransferase 2-like [Nerophis lumbriciformis]
MDLEAQIEEISSSAKFGDLIEYTSPMGFSHWAVYDDDGHVIHFALAEEGQLMYNIRTSIQSLLPVPGDILLGTTIIRRTPLGEIKVASGGQILIGNDRHAFEPSSPEEMRRRCHALEGEELGYNVLWFNCEHFATFVRYGKSVCNQIPTSSINVETKSATKVFQDIVDAKAAADNDDLSS